MDFFNRSVDPTLWVSRTFEDPEYDEDTAAAAISRSVFLAPKEIARRTLDLLVVACGSDAIRAVRASAKLPEQLSFESEDLKIPFYMLGKVGILFVDVPDTRCVALASSALASLTPKCTLVLSSAARWVLRGRPEPGVVWLHTPAAVRKCGPAMVSPTFVDGAAAAFISEALMSKRALSAATLVKEGMNACYHDIELVRRTVIDFVGVDSADWLTGDSDFEVDVRRHMKEERSQESAMYM